MLSASVQPTCQEGWQIHSYGGKAGFEYATFFYLDIFRVIKRRILVKSIRTRC